MDQDSDKTIVPSNLPGFAQPGDTNVQDTSDALPVGTRLGEFEILGLVGKGGFGIVYRAYDHSLECEVALKEYMPSGLATRSQTVLITVRSRADIDTFNMGLQSFIKEARMLRRFDSPSLVKVFRFWEANGTAYMVMPFYEGMTLKQAFKSKSIVPDEPWIRFFLTNLLDALDIIHKANCYHRDIAPDNIILSSSDGHPVLLDFGAARRVISDSTQVQTAILKPGFAPIEQYADIPGYKQGAWTDIYALGALVYYLITGRAPVAAVSRIVNDNNIPAREAGKGRFSQTFLHAIDRAMAVRPENRIRTVAELREALNLPENLSRTLPPFTKPTPQPSQRIEPIFPDALPGVSGAEAGSWKDVPFFQRAKNAGSGIDNPAKRRKLVLFGTIAAVALVVVSTGVYRGMKGPTNVQASNKQTVEQPVLPANKTRSPVEGATDGTKAGIPTASGGEQKALPPTEAQPAAMDTWAAKDNSAKQAERPDQGTTVRPTSAEDQLWASALAYNNGSGYEAYLKAYPNGKYSAVATKALDKSAAASSGTKRTEPLAPSATATPAPNGSDPTASRAGPGKTLASQEASAEEENNWRVASSMDNLTAYESYLSKYPSGKYAVLAKSKIVNAKKSASPATVANVDSSKAPDSGKLVAPVQPPIAPATEHANAQQHSGQGGEPAGAIAGANPSATTPPSVPASTTGTGEPTIAKLGDTTSREPASASPAPRQQDAGRAIPASGQVLRIGEQTLTGNFSHDSVTGLVSGTGQVSWANGDRFEGTLARGIKQGKGDFVWANGQRYRGEWARDLPNGKGTMTFQNGNIYEGDMKDGTPNGKGTLTFSDGQRYRGELKDGLPHGKGTTRFSNGDSYTGDWRLGKSHGLGRYIWANGSYWDGEFKDDKRTDNGKMFSAAEASANGAIATTSVGKDGATDNPNQTAPDLKN